MPSQTCQGNAQACEPDWSCKNSCHKVYGIPKYSLSNLRKSSSVNTVPVGFFFSVFSGGWSLDFLPLFWARTFRQYRNGKKQQSLLSRPSNKTVIFKLTCSIPAVLQEPCCLPECFQRKVRGKPLMLTKAGHWDSSRHQLVIWSQMWKLFPSNCHRDKNIDFIAELSETMTFFFIPSLHDTNQKTNTLVDSPLHFLIHCHLLSQFPAWETLAYTSLFM